MPACESCPGITSFQFEGTMIEEIGMRELDGRPQISMFTDQMTALLGQIGLDRCADIYGCHGPAEEGVCPNEEYVRATLSRTMPELVESAEVYSQFCEIINNNEMESD